MEPVAMPGGRPYRPRCSKCSKRVLPLGHLDGFNLQRTGSIRHRDGIAYREVVCLDCQHVGWTMHEQAKHLPAVGGMRGRNPPTDATPPPSRV